MVSDDELLGNFLLSYQVEYAGPVRRGYRRKQREGAGRSMRPNRKHCGGIGRFRPLDMEWLLSDDHSGLSVVVVGRWLNIPAWCFTDIDAQR